jgi:hypothetical protein
MSAIQQRVSHRRLFLRPGVTTEIAAPSMVETVNVQVAVGVGRLVPSQGNPAKISVRRENGAERYLSG